MKRKGFTLVEILFVIAVVAILAGIVIPRLTKTKDAAQDEACDANIANINTQIERYYFEEGSWPAIGDLDGDVKYFPDAIPTCPVTYTSPAGTAYAIDAAGGKHRVYDAGGADHDHDGP